MTQTLNPAGYDLILECKHNRLRQAILNHQGRPKIIGTPVVSRETEPLSPDQVRRIVRGGYKLMMAAAVFTCVTLGLDLVLIMNG